MVGCVCRATYFHILTVLLFRDGRLQQASETEIQERARVVTQPRSDLTASDVSSDTCRRLDSDAAPAAAMQVEAGKARCSPSSLPGSVSGHGSREMQRSFTCLTNTTSVVLKCPAPLTIKNLRIYASHVCPKHWYEPPYCNRSCRERCKPRQYCDQWTGNCLQPCPDGFYGYDCERPCRCKDPTEICNDVTGFCKSGCAPGYDPAGSCSQRCPTGWFGDSCSRRCSCKEITDVCDSVTGEWPSRNQTWGPGCSQQCNCLFGAPCHAVTGVCPQGCLPGFQQINGTCLTMCPTGTYGVGCAGRCSTCHSGRCSPVDGVCTAGGCLPGWKGATCRDKCQEGEYGRNCSQTCGHCLSPCDVTTHCLSPCDGTTGDCLDGRCTDGYCGRRCDEKTIVPMPEVTQSGCQKGCGRCLAQFCVKSQEICALGCQPGFYGVSCEAACPQVTKDLRCSHGCGRCPDATKAQRHKRTSPPCPPGVTANNCTPVCAPNTWGDKCNNTCPETCVCGCDRRTGTCIENCQPEQTSTASSERYVGSSPWYRLLIFFVVLLIAGGVMTIVIMRRRRRTTHKTARQVYDRLMGKTDPNSKPTASLFKVDPNSYSPEDRAELLMRLQILVRPNETCEEFLQSSRMRDVEQFLVLKRAGSSYLGFRQHKRVPDIVVEKSARTAGILRNSLQGKRVHSPARGSLGFTVHFSPSTVSNRSDQSKISENEDPPQTPNGSFLPSFLSAASSSPASHSPVSNACVQCASSSRPQNNNHKDDSFKSHEENKLSPASSFLATYSEPCRWYLRLNARLPKAVSRSPPVSRPGTVPASLQAFPPESRPTSAHRPARGTKPASPPQRSRGAKKHVKHLRSAARPRPASPPRLRSASFSLSLVPHAADDLGSFSRMMFPWTDTPVLAASAPCTPSCAAHRSRPADYCPLGCVFSAASRLQSRELDSPGVDEDSGTLSSGASSDNCSTASDSSGKNSSRSSIDSSVDHTNNCTEANV